MTLPTDPLAGGKPAARRSDSGLLMTIPPVERRDPARSDYAGPERRRERPEPRRILGVSRGLLIAAAFYLGLLTFFLVLIFNY